MPLSEVGGSPDQFMPGSPPPNSSVPEQKHPLLDLPPDILRLLFQPKAQDFWQGVDPQDSTKPLKTMLITTCRSTCRRLRAVLNHSKAAEMAKRICAIAASEGCIRVMAWARSQGASLYLVPEAASFQGRIEVLEWYLANGRDPLDTENCAVKATEGGQFELLKWAQTKGISLEYGVCAAAARIGRFDILQWAHSKGVTLGWDVCVAAASAGRLDILQWAHSKGAILTMGVCTAAASIGRLDILQWARVNGCLWDEGVVRQASRSGHFELVYWAYNNGAPWDPYVCKTAASGGHFEVLEWAQANHVLWDVKGCCAEAIKSGHRQGLELARTLLDHGDFVLFCYEYKDFIDRYCSNKPLER